MSRKYFLHDGIEYHPDSGELYIGGKVENLQSLENKLLLHFVTHADALISKEELYNVGWSGRIYGDNPLSKAISNIRAKLGDSPKNPRFIKTIPKKGFRFISTVSEQPAPGGQNVVKSDEEATPQPKSGFSLNPISKTIAGATSTVAILWLTLSLMHTGEEQLSPQKIEHIKRMTHTPAQERDPDVTRDGELVVFSRLDSVDGLSQLVIKPVNGAPEIQLTNNSFNNLSPKFHQDGKHILYHRFADQRCEIALIELDHQLNVVSDIMLASCSKYSQSLGLSWGPGDSIFYTDIDLQFGPMNLYRLDINSGNRTLIAESPQKDGRGYYRVHYDPLSEQIYALLSVGWFNSEIVTLDLKGNILSQYTVNVPLFSVSSYNGNPVFRTPDNHISYLEGDQVKLLMQSPLRPAFSPSFSNRQTPLLAFIGGEFHNTQLIRLNLNNNTSEVILDTQVNNRHPVSTGSGDLYYISNSSGVYQIWRRNGEQNEQISQFRDNLYVDGMTISPDERYLAMVVADNTYVFLLDNTPLKLEQPFLLINNSINPHFSPNSNVLWSSKKDKNSYELVSYSLSNKQPFGSPIKHGYLGLFDSQTQQHLVFKYEQSGIWSIVDNQLQWFANAPLVTAINSIDVSGNIMTHYDDAKAALMQVDLTNQNEKVLAQQPYRFFTKLNNQPNQWIVTLRQFGNTDVFLTQYAE